MGYIKGFARACDPVHMPLDIAAGHVFKRFDGTAGDVLHGVQKGQCIGN